MSLGNNVVKPHLLKPVAVKTLIEFAAKTGSLERGYTPRPSAIEGIEGHKQVTAKRSNHYQAEISLNITYRDLVIRGRADGYQSDRHCIEEIKTFYGNFDRIPAHHQSLHWAQAKVYGWMLCTAQNLEQITLALVYYRITDQKEFRIEQHFSGMELKQFGCQLAEKYYLWQQQINQRLTRLATWIDELIFPYPELHSAQRQMAEAVYKSAVTGRVLLAEAPTGTGKTLAGLFPAIKALNKGSIDKIFYLTAKTTGKQLALDSLQLIITDSPSTPLRVLELTAQEKACLEPELGCTGDNCIFAENFYTKLDVARQAAYQIPFLNQQTLNVLALDFKICPFYLSMEMSRWVDIVVADFNYYFDKNALLFGLTKELYWRPYLLVDESHNLLERARAMYSATLNRDVLLAAKHQAPKIIKKYLGRINRSWSAEISSAGPAAFKVLTAPLAKLSLALAEFTNRYIEFLQQQPDHPIPHGPLQEFFFAALNFQFILARVNEDFCIDMDNSHSNNELLRLRNLIPARLLKHKLEPAWGACFFSATLKPANFYQTLLGLPSDTQRIEVPSPFHPDQLVIKIAHNLSTRYRDRASAVTPICALVKQQLQLHPGNAIIFCSSYEFLSQLEAELRASLAQLNIEFNVQSRHMGDAQRQEFIDRFSGHNHLLGLAVLGGAFSEGIDLPGDALKGVFIATLGLPQVNSVNEYLRQYLDAKFGQGYNFTYLYPGIQKVIQAAGRVIRSTTDQGYVWLLDQRFATREVRQLLPSWWNIAPN